MVRFARIASALSLFTFLAVGTAAVANAAPQEEAGVAQLNAPRPMHRGRGDLLRASLHLDSLTASQRQRIEALVAGEKAAHANIAQARTALVSALADRVAAGSVDDVALAPNVQAVEGAIAADEPGDRAALEKLHAILTPAQRTELVSKVESRGTHGRPATEAGPPRKGMWGQALNLSDAQKQQIATNMKSIGGPAVDRSVWQEARESHTRVLEAFKGNRFVMNEIAPARDPRLVDQGVERMVRMAKASAPVLTQDQRVTAAAKLRTMAARGTK
jgi:Spy/CpxP family protein refolding chaperone